MLNFFNSNYNSKDNKLRKNEINLKICRKQNKIPLRIEANKYLEA